MLYSYVIVESDVLIKCTVCITLEYSQSRVNLRRSNLPTKKAHIMPLLCVWCSIN